MTETVKTETPMTLVGYAGKASVHLIKEGRSNGFVVSAVETALCTVPVYVSGDVESKPCRHAGPNLAAVRDALNADQRDPETWEKISPAEALAIRQSYFAAEDEIRRLQRVVSAALGESSQA